MKTSSRQRTIERKDQAPNSLTSRNQVKKTSTGTTPTTEFGRTLKDLLGKTYKAGQVNEEELFAATTHQLILNRFGESVADDFKSAFKLNMADKPPSERFASAERAAKESLKFFVNSTVMTREEARQIRQLAFTTAQLDENVDVAWDSVGDTKAVTSFAKGEKLIQGRLEASGNAPIVANRGSRPSKVTASQYRAETGPNPRLSRGSVKRSA